MLHTNVGASYSEAKKKGLTLYAGEPCKECGSDTRRTSNRKCNKCHKIKVKEYRKTEKGRAARVLEARRKDKTEKGKAARKRRAKKRLAKEAVRIKMSEATRRWQKANPDKVKVINNNRRARLMGASGNYTSEEINALLVKQNYKCNNPYCCNDLRITGKHLDHDVPLSRGGSNDIANLQWLCPSCNMSKGAKTGLEFAGKRRPDTVSSLERKLSCVPRWTIVRTIRNQNVAEHTYYVTLFAIRLMEQWARISDAYVVLSAVDYAMVHDFTEVLTGDVPTPLKKFIDVSGVSYAASKLGIPSYAPSDLVTAVVKTADLFEAALFLCEEISLGNNAVVDILNVIKCKLQKAASGFEAYYTEDATAKPGELYSHLSELLSKAIHSRTDPLEDL